MFIRLGRSVLVAAVVASLTAAPSFAGGETRLGTKVEPAGVVGLDGRPADVPPAAPAAATVVVFLSFECPVSNSYASTLTDLAKSHTDRGVRVIGVCPTDEPAGAVKNGPIGAGSQFASLSGPGLSCWT